jgi:hypothetical protein
MIKLIVVIVSNHLSALTSLNNSTSSSGEGQKPNYEDNDRLPPLRRFGSKLYREITDING